MFEFQATNSSVQEISFYRPYWLSIAIHTLSQNLAASNRKHLFSNSFWRSGMQVQLSWVFWFKASNKTGNKVCLGWGLVWRFKWGRFTQVHLWDRQDAIPLGMLDGETQLLADHGLKVSVLAVWASTGQLTHGSRPPTEWGSKRGVS